MSRGDGALFTLFGPSHWAVLAAVISVSALLVLIARGTGDFRVTRTMGRALAGILFANELSGLLVAHSAGNLSLQSGLPMHLCDFATLAAILALLWKWQLAYELAYFWGLAGSFQALITPDLGLNFPDVRFFTFFVGHGGVIVAALFLTFAVGLRPRPSSILRAFAYGQLYLMAAALVDWLANANYGYLREKPLHGSLMDYLGPWPWYLVGVEMLALLSFGICYLPFYIADKLRAAPGEGRR